MMRVYVGTYGKYANGDLTGDWLTLSDYEDKEAFLAACKELHKDEESPEFMFQDWENIPDGLVTESKIEEVAFSFARMLPEMSDTEQRAFMAWCDYKAIDWSRDDDSILVDFWDEYVGEYDSEVSFAEELIDQCYDLDEFCRRYFDTAALARDLFITDYIYEDGFVFRRA